MPHLVIANRLRDGIVVFLGTDHAWVERVEACPPADGPEEGERLLATALETERKQEVVDPTLIEVAREDDAWVPVKRRETIRSRGPTNRRDLGKQAGN